MGWTTGEGTRRNVTTDRGHGALPRRDLYLLLLIVTTTTYITYIYTYIYLKLRRAPVRSGRYAVWPTRPACPQPEPEAKELRAAATEARHLCHMRCPPAICRLSV